MFEYKDQVILKINTVTKLNIYYPYNEVKKSFKYLQDNILPVVKEFYCMNTGNEISSRERKERVIGHAYKFKMSKDNKILSCDVKLEEEVDIEKFCFVPTMLVYFDPSESNGEPTIAKYIDFKRLIVTSISEKTF